MKATDHAVLAAIRKRADRDRLGYNGKAFVSKDPKVEIVEDRQWLLEFIDQEMRIKIAMKDAILRAADSFRSHGFSVDADELEESLSEGNLGEPKACTPAEERGIVGATGAGQLPATTAETRDSAERRSPGGHSASPSLDESNQHLTALRTALADAAGIITLATDLKPISEWQHDLVRRAEAWISSYYKNCINQGIVTMSEQMAGTVNQSNAVWLIESVDSEPTIYFCGVGDWCSNPHHAYKFAVREAAEANRLSMVNPSNFKVTEHLF